MRTSSSSVELSSNGVHSDHTSILREDTETGSPRSQSNGDVMSPRSLANTESPRFVNGESVSPRYGNGSTFSRRYANAAKQRAEVVEWLNGMFQGFKISSDASEDELRARLTDGTILCCLMKKLNPNFVSEVAISTEPMSPRVSRVSPRQRSENIQKFLSALDDIGVPKFEASDLDQGPLTAVMECLLNLKDHYLGFENGLSKHGGHLRKRWGLSELECSMGEENGHGDLQHGPTHEERQRSLSDPKFLSDPKLQTLLRAPVLSDTSSAWLHHVGQKFNEVFQLSEGRNLEAPGTKNAGTMNLNGLDNAPTQSLLSVVNSILGEKQNGEVPPRIEILLRKVMQEIERRLTTQGEHIKKLKLALREVLAREERLVSRAGVLETLATGTSEEIKMVSDQLQKIKTEKNKMEEKRKLEEQDVLRLMKEKENIANAIASLNQELETTKMSYEQRCLHLEAQGKEVKVEMEEKLKALESSLAESEKKKEETEAVSEQKIQYWKCRDLRYQKFLVCQSQSIYDLRGATSSVKKEIADVQRSWCKEINNLGFQLQGLVEAAENYHQVLAENRKLYNEVQDLKGNIRVYCRVRPFISGQAGKLSIVECIGEDGELVVANPAKQGKEAQRQFKFNKVFGPAATQEEVFMDTRPLIRSVLDGYNVCIFAYGQTGSGKTYTMSGPDALTPETWGVNYRALNDLFQISRKRSTSYRYEIGVQMVEIYNEQVRDLLSADGQQKKLGIWNTSQPNGLSVPDASMYPVGSTGDVLDLMQIGLNNRAVGATALNVRSSRSHSVLTVHVRGTDLKSGNSLRGSLHLVDLAGSERVDRSEATGDRLKEAQHINKSLSALGDVIFALAQKNAHVPYRNSKLTQLLQGSLGGQAKTLMFVQLNPDVDSYSETVSTLKFAERVSGVELGAAKSNKENKDTRDLMDQVAALKDLVAKKDAEIERLHYSKDQRVISPETSLERLRLQSPRHSIPSSPSRHSTGSAPFRTRRTSGNTEKVRSTQQEPGMEHSKSASDLDSYSEYSDKNSEVNSYHSADGIRHQSSSNRQSRLAEGDSSQSASGGDGGDVDLLGFGDGESEERLSDISDGGLSMGTETDGSISSIVELTLFPESSKSSTDVNISSDFDKHVKVPTRLPRPPSKSTQSSLPQSQSRVKDSLKTTSSLRKSVSTKTSSSSPKPPPSSSSSSSSKRWQ